MLLFVLLSLHAQAQETWDLTRILNHSAEHTFSLKAKDQEVISAANTAKQQGRWDNPEVGVSNGPYWEDNIKGTATSASLSQSIPLFGQKRIAEKIGEQQKMVVEADRDIERLSVQHEVVRLTYWFATIIEQEKHISHRRERLGLITKYLNSRPFASPAQVIEKNLIENRMREIEEKFVEITLQKEKVWQNLNVYLGLQKTIIPGVPWYNSPELPNQQELNSLATTTNPELVRQGRIVSSSQLLVTQAGKKAYPDIRLGANYYNQEVGIDKQKSYVGMIELSVPLWNRGGYAKDAARAQSEAEKYKLQHKQREVDSEFKKEWAHLIEVKRKMELYPLTLVEKLEKQMQTAEKNWKKGLITAPAFLELESQVHEQSDKIYDVQAEYVHALSQVQLLSGRYFQAKGK